MTTENKTAFVQSVRGAIAFEFKNRHSFKGGRFTPRENVIEYIQIIRRMRKGEA